MLALGFRKNKLMMTYSWAAAMSKQNEAAPGLISGTDNYHSPETRQ
jgi:hypothetical protein